MKKNPTNIKSEIWLKWVDITYTYFLNGDPTMKSAAEINSVTKGMVSKTISNVLPVLWTNLPTRERRKFNLSYILTEIEERKRFS